MKNVRLPATSNPDKFLLDWYCWIHFHLRTLEGHFIGDRCHQIPPLSFYCPLRMLSLVHGKYFVLLWSHYLNTSWHFQSFFSNLPIYHYVKLGLLKWETFFYFCGAQKYLQLMLMITSPLCAVTAATRRNLKKKPDPKMSTRATLC